MEEKIRNGFRPVLDLFAQMIEGKTKEEQKTIIYDFIDELWVGMSEKRILESVKQREIKKIK